MEQMKKLGGISGILSMLPGMGLPKDIEIDDNAFKPVEAMISSMTLEERSNPAILNPSRKKRIAKGAGVDISEVNRLVKQMEQMKKMMKQMPGMMGGKGKKGKFRMPFGF
jgi:signal recognition particle subunit SRP54